MKLFAIAAILLLISCAHDESPTSNMAGPYVIVTPTSSHDAMYRVAFKNYENDGINIHSREVRHDLLENALDDNYCTVGYTVKHEEVVKEGLLTDFGRQSNYYIYVSCE